MSRTVMGYDFRGLDLRPGGCLSQLLRPQGIGADIIATLDGFSRTDVDSFAAESQRKAAFAWENGFFRNSIVPVKDVLGEVLLDHDEHMRPGTTVESMAKLKPAFEGYGKGGFEAVAKAKYPEIEELNYVHHGGNSSGIVDGAGMVLVGSKEFGERAGLKPRGRIRAYANIGSEPTIMLTAPGACSDKALKNAGMDPPGHRLVGIERGFCQRRDALSARYGYSGRPDQRQRRRDRHGPSARRDRGHDPGTVLDELERRDLETGLITLCAANGLGTASIIERV